METTYKTVTPLDTARVDAPQYRTPPHNLEAEKGLLGAILVNNRAIEKVSDFLRAEHFADALHGRIFEAARKLADRGQIANPVTLKPLFDQDEALAEVGGAQYLVELAAHAVQVINPGDYGRMIHDLFLRRELIGLGEEMVNDAHTQDVDVAAQEQIEVAEERLFSLAEAGAPEGGFVSLGHSTRLVIDHADRAMQREDKITGVTTGLADVDAKMGGLQPSDLIILAGRPSMGKTALATNIAVNAAKAHGEVRDDEDRVLYRTGARVAFFSLEMSAEQLAARILAEHTGVSSDRMRRGDIKADDFKGFIEASDLLASIPFYIDDTPALTVAALRTRARRLHRRQGLDLIVVDYLQLLRGAVSGSDSRVQEISEISRGLKAIAKELNLPVLALSQLSRQVEQRDDKRPQLSDLRESGSIEQDADVVMFIFREQYYLERAEPQQKPDEDDVKFQQRYERWQERFGEAHNKADVNIAKQRHGPIGTVQLYFDGMLTKFSDLARDDYLPDARG